MGSGPSGACCCDRSAGGTAASPTTKWAVAACAAAVWAVAADAEAEAPRMYAMIEMRGLSARVDAKAPPCLYFIVRVLSQPQQAHPR